MDTKKSEPCRNKARWPKLKPNRFVLLGLYLLVVLLRGCTYWGWNGIQEMLYKSDAYLWECTDPASNTTLRIGNDNYVDCPTRKQMLGGIFTTALGSNMISSFLAGIILDTLGPKVSILFGILMDVVGWLLLGFSGHHFQAYYAAAFCIGVSADPGYLPLLSINKLFPKNSSLIISLLGSMRSVSFAVPVIMSVVYQSNAFGSEDLWRICVGYVGIAQGISLIIAILFVPMVAFKYPEDAYALGNEANIGADDCASNPTVAKDEELARRAPKHEQDTRSFRKLLVDPKFLLLLPIFICALIRSDYYTKSNKEQLMETSTGRDLQQMFSVCNILSFIPGPIFGQLVDLYGILVVLLILNTSGVFMFIFLMFDYLACKGISIMFFFIYTSFVLSNVYCYISINFPAHAFGKLTGFTSAMGGVFVLLSILWYEKLLEYEFPTNFIVTDGIMVGVGLFVFTLIFALWRIDVKNKKQMKVLDTQQTATESPEAEAASV